MQGIIVEQLVGQAIGEQGQYRVERLLGQNRLNAVYLARHLSDQKMMALTLFLTPNHFSLDPYLLTPYLTHGSLADRLRQQKRFSYEVVGRILEQIAPAVQLAHSRNLVHGTLKPDNLVLNNQQQVVVAGFGLMHLLQWHGIIQSQHPYAHLLSVAETFLAAPEYLAPEVIEGCPLDARADIYALGCILFEFLTGKPPFTGNDPQEVAHMHMQQSLPSLRALIPDLPLALVSVVQQALARDPQRRFQQVQDLLEAFSQVVQGVSALQQRIPDNRNIRAELPEGQPERALEDRAIRWQLAPPIVTGKFVTISSRQYTTSAKAPLETTSGPVWASISPPVTTGHLDAVRVNTARPLPQPTNARPIEGSVPPPTQFSEQELQEPRMRADEEAWWMSSLEPQAPLRLAQPRRPERKNAKMPQTSGAKRNFAREPRKRMMKQNRRQVLAVIATGGVVAAGTLIVTNLHLLPLGGSLRQNMAMTMHMGPQGTNQSPRKQATQSPGQSKRRGTVIGSTALPVDTASPFSNPADGKASLLIHLPNGNFVAYERACTHTGMNVNYDPRTHTLVCPTQGTIFDPMKHGVVLQGPAILPLPMIDIQINTDGTITTI